MSPQERAGGIAAETRSIRLARVLLVVLLVAALVHPGMVLYTRFVDHTFSEQPYDLLSNLAVLLPFFVVVISTNVIKAVVPWSRSEQGVLLALLIGWFVPLVVAPETFSSLGCDDTSVAQNCSVAVATAPQTAVTIGIAILVVGCFAWLQRRLRT